MEIVNVNNLIRRKYYRDTSNMAFTILKFIKHEGDSFYFKEIGSGGHYPVNLDGYVCFGGEDIDGDDDVWYYYPEDQPLKFGR